MRIEIAVYEDFDEVDAIGPFEVLANVKHAHPEVEVELVGAHGAGQVVAGHGMKLLLDEGLSERADLVIVPGGGWVNGGGVRQQVEDGTLAARLRELHDGGVSMASVCTGGLLLAQSGILDGRPATTHHAAYEGLALLGTDVRVERESRVVDDGDVITSGGITSGFDLAFHLVERYWDAELAGTIATLMEYEPRAARSTGGPT